MNWKHAIGLLAMLAMTACNPIYYNLRSGSNGTATMYFANNVYGIGKKELVCDVQGDAMNCSDMKDSYSAR